MFKTNTEKATAARLKKIMSIRNIRQIDILNAAKPYCTIYNVKLNKSDLSQYISGINSPRQDKLKILSLALNVSPAWLMGFDVPMNEGTTPENISTITPSKKTSTFPVLGDIAAGFGESAPKMLHEDFNPPFDIPLDDIGILTENEKKIIRAYRAKPEMHESIHKLLDLDKK